MKTLVTGGSGFIGSHVADALSDNGYEVTILDVKESQYLRSNQKMVVGDILDEELLEKIVAEQDVVYHFAGIADIDECNNRPVDTAKFNILGTVQLLEACRKSKIKRFIFASSAYVFSDSGYFYRTSKQACELYIEDYYQLYGLKYTCLRYGSLYGDRADNRNSIHRFVRQAIEDGKITYHGTGEEFREFIHVKDAAQISVNILEPKYENQNIILTGTEKMRYIDLLEMIEEILNKKVEIEILPSERKAHYKISPYNFSPKLGRKLVSNPHIDMGQGLLNCMAEIYKEVRGGRHEEVGLLISEARKHE
jgi:UDP-glucose 4-epimerase